MNSHVSGIAMTGVRAAMRDPTGSTDVTYFGDEPALTLDGHAHPSTERHGFSYRWLFASLLVGVCGCALLGAAVYVAVQGDTTFAEVPEPAAAAAPAATSVATTTRKSDKLVQQAPLPSARQVIRAPFSQRVGDREVVRNRSFIKLAAGLSLTAGNFTADIPPFNPLRLFSEGGPNVERVAEQISDAPDGDLFLVKRDLGSVTIGSAGGTLSDADVIAQIEEERANQAAAGRRFRPSSCSAGPCARRARHRQDHSPTPLPATPAFRTSRYVLFPRT
jgi:hypothetical protein